MSRVPYQRRKGGEYHCPYCSPLPTRSIPGAGAPHVPIAVIHWCVSHMSADASSPPRSPSGFGHH